MRFMTIDEVGGGRFPGFSPDVFCVVEGPKTGDFKRIRYTAPTNVRDMPELENIILSSDVYSYRRSIDFYDTLVFKNVSNIYSLYNNGLMEYNYIPLTQPAEKGGVAAALEIAAGYIMNIEQNLLGGADLVLSGIYGDESDLTYRFTFDYIIDDYPVYFVSAQPDTDVYGEYQNAISIVANSNRAISCRWMLVDLFFTSESKDMHLYFDRIEVGQSLTGMAVTDISVAYVVYLTDTPETGGTSITGGEPGAGARYGWPVWAITAPDGAVEAVDMTEG